MDTLGKRIRQLRGSESQEDFARRIGVSKGSVGGYERDENSPSADAIIKICSLDNISSEWLLFGTGPVKAGDSESFTSADSTAEALKKRIAELEEEKRRLEFELCAEKRITSVYQTALEALQAMAAKGGTFTIDALASAPSAPSTSHANNAGLPSANGKPE